MSAESCTPNTAAKVIFFKHKYDYVTFFCLKFSKGSPLSPRYNLKFKCYPRHLCFQSFPSFLPAFSLSVWVSLQNLSHSHPELLLPAVPWACHFAMDPCTFALAVSWEVRFSFLVHGQFPFTLQVQCLREVLHSGLGSHCILFFIMVSAHLLFCVLPQVVKVYETRAVLSALVQKVLDT